MYDEIAERDYNLGAYLGFACASSNVIGGLVKECGEDILKN